jgi:hypothetical protein
MRWWFVLLSRPKAGAVGLPATKADLRILMVRRLCIRLALLGAVLCVLVLTGQIDKLATLLRLAAGSTGLLLLLILARRALTGLGRRDRLPVAGACRPVMAARELGPPIMDMAGWISAWHDPASRGVEVVPALDRPVAVHEALADAVELPIITPPPRAAEILPPESVEVVSLVDLKRAIGPVVQPSEPSAAPAIRAMAPPPALMPSVRGMTAPKPFGRAKPLPTASYLAEPRRSSAAGGCGL